MTHELNDVLENLKLIRDNLVKLNYQKRTPDRLKEKLDEANIVFNRYSVLVSSISKQIEKRNLVGKVCPSFNIIVIRLKKFI